MKVYLAMLEGCVISVFAAKEDAEKFLEETLPENHDYDIWVMESEVRDFDKYYKMDEDDEEEVDEDTKEETDGDTDGDDVEVEKKEDILDSFFKTIEELANLMGCDD